MFESLVYMEFRFLFLFIVFALSLFLTIVMNYFYVSSLILVVMCLACDILNSLEGLRLKVHI